MLKNISFMMLLILAMALSACAGEQAPATMAAADVQNTAVSGAYTMVALTQAAVPTATLMPPPTDMPTDTPIPLPTFTPEGFIDPSLPPLDTTIPTLPQPLALPSPTAASSFGTGDCNQILDVSEAGPISAVRIQNQTNGDTVSPSLHLSTNAFGQCGYMPGVPQIARKSAATINLPTGNWFFCTFINYDKGKSGNFCTAFTVQPGGADTVKITDN